MKDVKMPFVSSIVKEAIEQGLDTSMGSDRDGQDSYVV